VHTHVGIADGPRTLMLHCVVVEETGRDSRLHHLFRETEPVRNQRFVDCLQDMHVDDQGPNIHKWQTGEDQDQPRKRYTNNVMVERGR
jgi:hypothetical protein